MKVSDQPHFVHCTPQKEPPVPVKWEAEWAPDLASTLWGRKCLLSVLEIKLWFLGRPSCSPGTVVTELSKLHQHIITGGKNSKNPSSRKHNDDSNSNNDRNIKCQNRVNNLHATVFYTRSIKIKNKVQTCITILHLHRYYIAKKNKF